MEAKGEHSSIKFLPLYTAAAFCVKESKYFPDLRCSIDISGPPEMKKNELCGLKLTDDLQFTGCGSEALMHIAV